MAPKIGTVTSKTIAENGGRLDAEFYLDHCKHCGAQEKAASNMIGVWQHHPDDGRCCRYVKKLEFKGTCFASQASSSCQHSIDWSSLRYADGTSTPCEGIADVWCKKCGKSGSVMIDAQDINWGDDDAEST